MAQPANFRKVVDAELLAGNLAALLSLGKNCNSVLWKQGKMKQGPTLTVLVKFSGFTKDTRNRKNFSAVGKRQKKETVVSGQFRIAEGLRVQIRLPAGSKCENGSKGKTLNRPDAKEWAGITRSAG